MTCRSSRRYHRRRTRPRGSSSRTRGGARCTNTSKMLLVVMAQWLNGCASRDGFHRLLMHNHQLSLNNIQQPTKYQSRARELPPLDERAWRYRSGDPCKLEVTPLVLPTALELVQTCSSPQHGQSQRLALHYPFLSCL